MKFFYTLIIFVLMNNNLQAQNENNYWYFGNNVGLDFSNNPPIAITGNLSTLEGCASISTNDGNLLFYTDGITVYNKNGAIMINGNGLLGNPSSTSSAIIVPKPCSNTEYIIFTVDYVNGSNGVNYSLVNMDNNNDGIYDPLTENGYVDSSMKNINLPGPTGERICAIKHNNDIDYWVTTTKKNTNNYYTYLVSDTGVSSSIVQTLGPNIGPGFYMKISPDGTKLIRTDSATKSVRLMDFNNLTGQISNDQLVGTVPGNVYGVEFSANSQKLFYSDFANGNGTGNGGIYEVTITPSIGVPTQIATIPNQGGRYAVGALQQSPVDPNIIYAAMDGEYFLGEINVASSTFNRTALALTNRCYLGLPTFVSGQIKSNCLTLEPYANAVPDLFSLAVKNELTSGGFATKDKDFGDFDNDGDIDILYSKIDANNDVNLYVLINNAGVGNTPSYNLPGTFLLWIGPQVGGYSYRFVDWNNDNYNDVIVHGKNGGTHLFINNQSGGLQSGSMMLNGGVDYPSVVNQNQLIEVADINNDGLYDLLISGQGSIYGTAYFENNGTNTYPYFTLASPQNYTSNSITNIFIPENNGSFPTPEVFDADCDGDMDVFISDPLLGLPNYDGGRMYFYENQGGLTTGILPNMNTVGVDNQYGFVDVSGSDLRCDWIITRIVDYFGTDCPIAIAFNPCTDEFYYYDQDCSCESLGNSLGINDELENELFHKNISIYPNPTQNQVSIKTDRNTNYTLFSISGQLLKKGVLLTGVNTLDVSTLDKGIYFVNITTNNVKITKKLILK